MIAEKIGMLVRRTTIFGVSGVLSRLSGLITFPILTKAIGAEQFGALDYYMTVANLIGVVAVFGLDSAGARFYFQSNDPGERRRTLSQVISLQTVPIMLLFAAGAVILVVWKDSNGLLLALVLWQAALAALISFLQYLMIWRDEKRHYLISTVGQTLLTMAVLVWACAGRSPSIAEVLAIFFGARLATAAHGLYATRGQFTLTVDRQGLGTMLRYGWPIGVICTLSALMPFVERQSILSLMSETDLGLYAAASRIAMLLTLPIAAFQIVWVPFAFSHFRDPEAERMYRAILKLFAILGFASALGIAAVGTRLLILLTTPEFVGGRIAIFPICFAIVIKGLGDIAQIGIDISLKSHLKLITYGVMAVLALILTPFLTHAYGILGAAWGMAIAFAGKAISEYRLAQRAHPFDWHGSRVMNLTLIVCALGLGFEFSFSYLDELGIAFVGLGSATAVLLAGWFLVLDATERAQLFVLLKRQEGIAS